MCSPNKWNVKLDHRSMTYLLSNNSTKNYRNLTTTVKIIVERSGGNFLQHGVEVDSKLHMKIDG